MNAFSLQWPKRPGNYSALLTSEDRESWKGEVTVPRWSGDSLAKYQVNIGSGGGWTTVSGKWKPCECDSWLNGRLSKLREFAYSKQKHQEACRHALGYPSLVTLMGRWRYFKTDLFRYLLLCFLPLLVFWTHRHCVVFISGLFQILTRVFLHVVFAFICICII